MQLREAALQHGHDPHGLVDAQRGLRQHGDARRIRNLHTFGLLGGGNDDRAVRRLADDPFDLDVVGVADQQDREAAGGEPLRLDVHLGHQRAGRVDRVQVQLLRLGEDRGGDAVRAEDHVAAGRHVGEVVDEARALLLEVPHDDLVVHDLVADVDRPSELGERPLDGFDGALDAGTEAAGTAEEDLHGGRRVSAPQAGTARAGPVPARRRRVHITSNTNPDPYCSEPLVGSGAGGVAAAL